MSTFIDYYLANNTGNYVAVNMGGKATEKELDEIRKMLLMNTVSFICSIPVFNLIMEFSNKLIA